jgi:acyl-CoA thioester hydrolase
MVKVRVRYDDLDTLGHVNNKTYLSYLEESRIGYMEDVMGFMRQSLDFDVVVGRIDIKYLSPVFFHDKLEIYTRISRIGEKSYDFECWITKNTDGEMQKAAYALVTMVSVDTKTGKSKPNSEKMVSTILLYEEEKPEMK